MWGIYGYMVICLFYMVIWQLAKIALITLFLILENCVDDKNKLKINDL